MKKKNTGNRGLLTKRIGVDETFGDDLYHRLLRMTWPRFFLLMLCLYLMMNCFFAFLYWMAPGSVAGVPPGDFLANLSFSIETFSTIGYGHFYPATGAARAIVATEAPVGLLSTALLTGIVFAKFAKPSARIVFSEHVLWSVVNGTPVISLRMGNVRANRVFEGRAKLTLLKDETSNEGEKIRRMVDLKLVRSESPLFSLSWTIYHALDETSPFYGITPEKAAELGWELIVTFMGMDQDMGQQIAANNMYSGRHFMRARKFADMITVENGVRIIDYSKLNIVETDHAAQP